MRRILIVDDSRAVRRMVEASVQPWGFEVHHAENGATALARLKASRFDLVLLDINMPVLDGPSVLRVMRAHGMDTKVVLITGGTASPLIASLVKMGVSDYLSKPFGPEQVRAVLARALSIDPATLPRHEPRVLLQSRDEAAHRRLRASLPDHVHLDVAPLLADALALAERARYALVLLEEELVDAAPLLRARQPHAAIFGMSPGATAPAHAPDGDVDGHVPQPFDERLVDEFLYPLLLRPLVFRDAGTLRGAGFEGPERHVDVYFGQLGRALRASVEQDAEEYQDFLVDLSRVPADVDRVADLIVSVHAALEAVGAGSAFVVPDAVREALAGRPALARVALVEPQ